MRLFWEVAKLSFQRWTTYRVATAAGAITNSAFGFMRAYILLALFQTRDVVGGLTATDALTYTFIAQGLASLVAAFGGHLPLAERIRTGDVVADLYRPFNLQTYCVAEDFGRAAFQACVRSPVPFVVGSFVFHLQLPRSGAAWVAVVISIVLANVVSVALRFMVTLATFWFLDYRGVSQTSSVIMLFFSGFILPISFFPGSLEAIARALPFQAVVQIPVEIWLGTVTGKAAFASLALQATWAVVLLFAGRSMLLAATRKVVIQGG